MRNVSGSKTQTLSSVIQTQTFYNLGPKNVLDERSSYVFPRLTLTPLRIHICTGAVPVPHLYNAPGLILLIRGRIDSLRLQRMLALLL